MRRKFIKAFTLTEVLIAVAIVGVIAALVLPVVITKYQENTLSYMYDREVKTISQAINSLAVTENKTSFYDTIMYFNTKPASYEDNAGRFLKKYLRVARYCGENNGDCFATNYFEYKDNFKKVYTPKFEGACASLKNGSSICITPQVGNGTITGIIDLNGKKEPNVYGRDLREFSITINDTRKGILQDSSEVYSTEYLVQAKEEECNSCDCDPSRPGCSTPPTPPDVCDDRNSAQCCVTPQRIAQISNSSDACCNVGNNRTTVAQCQPPLPALTTVVCNSAFADSRCHYGQGYCYTCTKVGSMSVKISYTGLSFPSSPYDDYEENIYEFDVSTGSKFYLTNASAGIKDIECISSSDIISIKGLNPDTFTCQFQE